MNRPRTVICPECAAENRGGRFFCSSCGAYLRDDEDTLETPASRVSAEPPPEPAEILRRSEGATAPSSPQSPPGGTGAFGAEDPLPSPYRRAERSQERRARRRRWTAVAVLIAFLFAVGVAAAMVGQALNAGDSGAEADPSPVAGGTETTEDVASTAPASEEEPPPPPRETTTTTYEGPVEQVEVVDVQASSSLDPTEQNTYEPRNLIDGELDTAWNENAEGLGQGEWFRLQLPETRVVRRLEIANGYQKDDERFLGNARIQQMEITFSDGSSLTAELANEQGYQSVETGARETQWVKITVTEVYGGDVWEDLAVSEVRVFADPEA